MTIVRFYKLNFFIGWHAAAGVWAFFAVRKAMDGHVGAAIVFAVLSLIVTMILGAIWRSLLSAK